MNAIRRHRAVSAILAPFTNAMLLIIFTHQNGRNTYSIRKTTVIPKITLTISNAEHIKQALSTNKPHRHQQHLSKISQNVAGAVQMAIRYGRNTCIVR